MGNGPTRRHALIVEDEVLISVFAAEALQEMGFHSVEVASAKAAMDQARSNDFDVAVIDVGLPDRSGDELIADLRALRADLPVIITTGYSPRSLQDRFRSQRQVVIISKPYDVAQLHAAIRALSLSGSAGVPS
jgi:DNA-binding response OmpR family regulator